MKSRTIPMLSLVLITACGVAEGKTESAGREAESINTWPCMVVDVGGHPLTLDRVEGLRTHVAPAPQGAAATRYAIDILLAEWMTTKQVGVMNDAEAIANYREVTRDHLAKHGVSGLSAEFAAARAEVGVRLSGVCASEI
jgi:hypothetical protein